MVDACISLLDVKGFYDNVVAFLGNGKFFGSVGCGVVEAIARKVSCIQPQHAAANIRS